MEGSTGTGTVPQIVYGVTCNEQTIEINYPGEKEKPNCPTENSKKGLQELGWLSSVLQKNVFLFQNWEVWVWMRYECNLCIKQNGPEALV